MSTMFDFVKIAFSPSPGRLTEEEELQLVKEFQKTGDPAVYAKLQLSLRNLVEKVISDALPGGNQMPASILRMKAEMELPKILQIYDPNQGTKLNTHIIGRLSKYLGNIVKDNLTGPYVPRNRQPDLNRYKQAIREAKMEFGKNPSEDQIRQFYPTDSHIKPFDQIKTYHKKSLMSDAVFKKDSDGDGVTFNDQFTTGVGITSNDLMDDIKKDEDDVFLKKHFNDLERKIIDSVVNDGKSFVQTSLPLGVPTSEVRRVIRRWYELTQK